jgi:hypothetical protein
LLGASYTFPVKFKINKVMKVFLLCLLSFLMSFDCVFELRFCFCLDPSCLFSFDSSILPYLLRFFKSSTAIYKKIVWVRFVLFKMLSLWDQTPQRESGDAFKLTFIFVFWNVQCYHTLATNCIDNFVCILFFNVCLIYGSLDPWIGTFQKNLLISKNKQRRTCSRINWMLCGQ